MAVMKVETDIITSFGASPMGIAVILVTMHKLYRNIQD